MIRFILLNLKSTTTLIGEFRRKGRFVLVIFLKFAPAQRYSDPEG